METNNKQLERFKNLLKTLFQFDQPELEFGLYRIMHARADEITQFLDKDLLPQVKAAFSEYQTADKAEFEKELKQAGCVLSGHNAARLMFHSFSSNGVAYGKRKAAVCWMDEPGMKCRISAP